MINNISIIISCEENRVPLFLNTLDKYASFKTNVYDNVELLVASRTIIDETWQQICQHSPFSYNKLFRYEQEGYNPQLKGHNICVANSEYDNILITSPEVMPITNGINQLMGKPRNNYLCMVYEGHGKQREVLCSRTVRSKTMLPYFLALLKKEDILDINGWDESMCLGYAMDDDDFGNRFTILSKHKHITLDHIIGEHQTHPRQNTSTDIIKKAISRNIRIVQNNFNNNIKYIEKGISQYKKHINTISLIDGVTIIKLVKHKDSRGWLSELYREDTVLFKEHIPKMFYISVTLPGIVRGSHEHVYQTDNFIFIDEQQFELVLLDQKNNIKETYIVGGNNPVSVIVPPGIRHSYKNISDKPGFIINCPNKLYKGINKKESVDEIRYEDMDK